MSASRGSRGPVVLSGVAMMVLGTGLMLGLMARVYPTLWARWLWFTGWVTAVSGAALVGLVFLHTLRSPRALRVSPNVLLRQALEAGTMAGVLVWLQWGRLLAWPLVLMAVVTFLALEGTWQAWQTPEPEPSVKNP